jgi:hypothetical protein
VLTNERIEGIAAKPGAAAELREMNSLYLAHKLSDQVK